MDGFITFLKLEQVFVKVTIIQTIILWRNRTLTFDQNYTTEQYDSE